MAGESGAIGAINDKNSFWFKVQKDEEKPTGQVGGAYMACNNIGNYLNGTQTYTS